MHVVMAVAAYTIILMKGRSKTQHTSHLRHHDVQCSHTCRAGPCRQLGGPPLATQGQSRGLCKPDIGTETHTRTRTHTLYVEIIIPHSIVNLLVFMAYVHTRI